LKPDVASQIVEKPITREDIFEPEGNAENGKIRGENISQRLKIFRKSIESWSD